MALTLAAYTGRLNYLANLAQAQRYLEIGVNAGQTFFQVHLPFKVAVDPVFLFNPSERGSDGEFFFSLTSDEFFEQLGKPGSSVHATVAKEFGDDPITFDLIFIDGLHTFEQTLRDFENSIKFAHSKTLWLIDDTVPSDEHSAIPDRGEAFKARAKAFSKDRRWHGDVFKMLPALHDGFPQYSYCTLVEENPQTVVWKSDVRDVVPAFSSVEEIAGMSCGDIAPNAWLYMFSTAADLPGLVGNKVEPSRAAQAAAHAKFKLLFFEDSRYQYYMRLLGSLFDFIPRLGRSIRKRIAKA